MRFRRRRGRPRTSVSARRSAGALGRTEPGRARPGPRSSGDALGWAGLGNHLRAGRSPPPRGSIAGPGEGVQFGNPKPIQRPHPPILVGGRSGATRRIAAEHAGIWNYPGRDLADATRRSRLLDRYCAEIGRDPAERVGAERTGRILGASGVTSLAGGRAPRRRAHSRSPRWHGPTSLAWGETSAVCRSMRSYPVPTPSVGLPSRMPPSSSPPVSMATVNRSGRCGRIQVRTLSDEEVVEGSLRDPGLFGLVFDRHFDAIAQFCIRRVGGVQGEDP